MLLRALGLLVLFTSAAAAQTPAERAQRARGAAAQSPAERASQGLNRETREDRFRDAARDARGDGRPVPPGVQQFEAQRRSFEPDVGRPEQNGRIPTGSASGTLPSMGPNPQR